MEQLIEKAILVGLNTKIFDKTQNSTNETLDELEALLETAGGTCVCKVLQNLPTPNTKTFIGEGKLFEIIELCKTYEADLIVFDNELSPSQIRNLEDITGLVIIDRSNLILDIFAKRAISLEGKMQVELAQYKYILPRLLGLGKSMSRLGGGIGTRGPGESKLESDRRHIRRRIEKLESDLKEVSLTRETMRRSRTKSEIPLVSIVGYTNAGKSTLLNLLTNASIHANDRLFDTLDTTTRKLRVSDTLEVFMSDTVGFIRKLPHHLVNAFRATLEELAYSDILLHVVDVSNPEYLEHMDTVLDVIKKLKADHIKIITVFNKYDLCEEIIIPEDLENFVYISAKTSMGIDDLLLRIEQTLGKGQHHITIVVPFCDGFVIDNLYKTSKIEILDYVDTGTVIKVLCDDATYGKISKYEQK
ncbi:MAG: GTPase HflX [Clostridia bacterium]